MPSPRSASVGDICVLLAPSREPTGPGVAFIDRLQADLGGELVTPLHVTVDRVACDDAAALIRSVRASIKRLRPAPVRVDRLYFLPSRSRGPEIVKLQVGPDPILEEDTNELLAAVRRCGVPSLYPADRFKHTITTLQRVIRRDSAQPDLSDLPIDLFVAEQVIVSRIVGLARYEVLDAAKMTTSA